PRPHFQQRSMTPSTYGVGAVQTLVPSLSSRRRPGPMAGMDTGLRRYDEKVCACRIARGRNMATNIKKLLLPKTMARAGWEIVEAREDIEGVPYDATGPKAELHALLEDAAGVALSVQPFSDP